MHQKIAKTVHLSSIHCVFEKGKFYIFCYGSERKPIKNKGEIIYHLLFFELIKNVGWWDCPQGRTLEVKEALLTLLK